MTRCPECSGPIEERSVVLPASMFGQWNSIEPNVLVEQWQCLRVEHHHGKELWATAKAAS